MRRIVCMMLLVILVCSGCSTASGGATLLSEAAMKEMEESRVGKELMVGLWEGPRKHAMSTQEDANARYAEIKEAGINMVFLYAELTDADWLNKSLVAAETNDVSLIVDLGGVYTKQDVLLDIVNKTKDSPAVVGYNIVDEPAYTLFEKIRSAADLIRKKVGEDKFVFCNLLPNYGSKLSFAENVAAGKTLYQTYLDSFCNVVQTDLLHVDYYPYHSDKAGDEAQITSMISCLLDVRNTAASHNIPWGGFLQSSRWGKYLSNGKWSGTRIPDEIEYRLITHLHLCFGAKTVSNFLYWSRNGSDPSQRVGGIFDGLITYEGERTEVYTAVQNTNRALHAMKGVYLSYNHEGFMTVNLSDEINDILGNSRVKSFDMVKRISSKGEFIVGCFADGDKKGLYVVNYKRAGTKSDELTIRLNQKCAFSVWGSEGLEQAGDAVGITVSLQPGEGCFIELERQ